MAGTVTVHHIALARGRRLLADPNATALQLSRGIKNVLELDVPEETRRQFQQILGDLIDQLLAGGLSPEEAARLLDRLT